ncbi:hypothetical protein [Flavobacterium hercynium]|uniref:DUF3575 domain-containing protein n=1 Tax=Flavobacterium hercynium TaxID=387094 RepID=A0A226HKH2_9FLAO|nr:hypothetical protein [Flavobacterium hercynium]OXA93990.1 hypothetical protein B0A66_05460 [Flavobacterium hercynium]SMP34694.1 hypothetical protein SAMN06265346_11874 [Flavobacterium hercynium]
MKRVCVLFFIFSLSINFYAQEIPKVEKNQFKINVLFPGFVYEHGFTTKNTLHSEFYLGFGYSNNSEKGENWPLFPTISEQFRHYYNLTKRADKGKKTRYNSGNFVALNATYYFPSFLINENEYTSSFLLGPVWGLQRTYKGAFNIGLNGGIGYSITSGDNKIIPIANFTLGWVLGK